MAEKIRINSSDRAPKEKMRNKSREKPQNKVHKGAYLTKEKTKKEKTNLNDPYFFTQDLKIPKSAREDFKTFFDLKKMIYENSEIRTLFENYRNASSRGIFKMKFTRSFIEHVKNSGQNLPISNLELSNMLEKINSDNEIYNYLVARIKYNLRLPTKEIGKSVLAGGRNAPSWMNEIKKDLQTRNEIAILGEKLKNPNLVSHWDNFVSKFPLSGKKKDRNQQFVEHLKHFNSSKGSNENEENFKRLMHWAENKDLINKSVKSRQNEPKRSISKNLEENIQLIRKTKGDLQPLVQTEKIQKDLMEQKTINDNERRTINLTKTLTKEEKTRELERYNLTYEKTDLQPAPKKFDNLTKLNQLLSNNSESKEVFDKFRTKCFNLRFSSKFIKYTKEQTKFLSESQQKLPELLEQINSNNELYNFLVNEINSGQIRSPTEISKEIPVDRHSIKRYLLEIGKDLHIRNEIQILGDEMDDPSLVNYWDKYMTANPVSRTEGDRYREFTGFLNLCQENHKSLFKIESENLERLIHWAGNQKKVNKKQKIFSETKQDAIIRQKEIKIEDKKPDSTVVYQPSSENREVIIRKPEGYTDKIKLTELIKNSTGMQILSIDKSQREFGRSKFVNIKSVQQLDTQKSVKLSLEDGRILTCPPNQMVPIYNSSGSGSTTERQIIEVKADELQLGDEPLVLHLIPLNENPPDKLSIFNLLEEEDLYVGMTREEYKKFSYKSNEQTDNPVINLINNNFTYSKVAKMYKCQWNSLTKDEKKLINEEMLNENYIFGVKIGEEAGKWHSSVLDLSNEFFKIMGWYVAEGSVYKNTTSIAQYKELHPENYEEIRKTIEKLGFKPGLDSNHCVRINSNIYTRVFHKLCSKGAYNKKIPWNLFNKERAKAFLDTYFKGDGNFDQNNRKRYSTTSEQLKNDILSLQGALGNYTSVQNPKSTDNIFRIIETAGRLYRRKKSGEVNFNGTTPVRIKNIEKIETSNPQISLETGNGWHVTTNGIIVSLLEESEEK